MMRPDEMVAAVELRDIALRLGRAWALRGVTLRIASGEMVAIHGHNGSGKTSLLRVIATALRPNRGHGSVYGLDLVRDANAIRACCSLLTHGTGLYGDLTAAENLEFAQRMNGDPVNAAAIEHALNRVGLGGGVARQRVRTFSSGMQRRAALARLFLRQHPLLLLDEPYNSLDPEGRRIVDELLFDVNSQGGSAIVVLHDLEQSGVVFDMTVELQAGRVGQVLRRADSDSRRAVAALA
ncbi:MAG TPA: heme ABC exporter ATP-binding protein CcmA [Gemmatimonadaceae bacterium]